MSRIIRTPIEAWDLGIFASRWHRRWRFIRVAHDHEPRGEGPNGEGPFKLYFLAGNIKQQMDEFYEGASK